MVNETTSGESGDIHHLPYPGTVLDQPSWYREAVRIKRAERHSEWFRTMIEEAAKRRTRK